jgi:uncharacterized protein YbjT (DUF2867 family)
MGAYRAIVIGGTGAVGSALVGELLTAPRCTGVTVVARRDPPSLPAIAAEDKLLWRTVDFERLERAVLDAAHGHDAAFCTMGIGRPSRVSREELWSVDVEYAGAFARACRKAGVNRMALLGAVGANATSRIYYLRVKAAAESAMRDQGFPRLSLFRPSVLATREIRFGAGDCFTQRLFPLVSSVLPHRLREIRVEDLARAMRVDAEEEREDGERILEREDFKRLLENPS